MRLSCADDRVPSVDGRWSGHWRCSRDAHADELGVHEPPRVPVVVKHALLYPNTYQHADELADQLGFDNVHGYVYSFNHEHRNRELYGILVSHGHADYHPRDADAFYVEYSQRHGLALDHGISVRLTQYYCKRHGLAICNTAHLAHGFHHAL